MTDRLYGCRESDHRSFLAGNSAQSLPTPAVWTDLRKFCTYVDDQIGEMCVGEAFSGAHWIATRGTGKRASRLGIYTGARVRERARKTDPIPDIGCDPADAIDGLVNPGVYPFDARDTDPSQISTTDTWDEVVASQPFQPDRLLPIERGDTDTVDSVLTMGLGVVCWGFVDETWSGLQPGVIWPGCTKPPRGGHARVTVGYQTINGVKAYWEWNSYGPDWANSGFALVNADVYRSGQMGFCAVLGGPVL